MRSLAANAVRSSDGDLSDPHLPPAQVVSLVKSHGGVRSSPVSVPDMMNLGMLGAMGRMIVRPAPPARALDRPALAERQVLPMTNSRNSLGDAYSTCR